MCSDDYQWIQSDLSIVITSQTYSVLFNTINNAELCRNFVNVNGAWDTCVKCDTNKKVLKSDSCLLVWSKNSRLFSQTVRLLFGKGSMH